MKNNGNSNHAKLKGNRNNLGYSADTLGFMEMKVANSKEKNSKKRPRNIVLLYLRLFKTMSNIPNTVPCTKPIKSNNTWKFKSKLLIIF